MGSGFVEETPLAHACACGFLNIVKVLLKYDVEVNFTCSVSHCNPVLLYILGLHYLIYLDIYLELCACNWICYN